MTTYSSTAISRNYPIPGEGVGGGSLKEQYGIITIPAGATTSDLFNLFYLPPHARVMSASFKSADLDTGTTVTLNIGDTGGYASDGSGAIAASANRYFAAATTPQTGGINTTMAAAGKYFFTGNKKVLVQASLGAGPTTTAGTLEVSVGYTVEEPQQQ